MFPQVLARAEPHAATELAERRLSQGLVVASLLLLGAIAFVPASGRLASFSTNYPLLGLLAVTSGVALRWRRWDGAHIALFTTLYLAAYCLPVIGRLWPLPSVIALAGYGIMVAGVGEARRTVRFWRRGRLDRTSVVLMVLFSLAAATALIIWRYASRADMTPYRQVVPVGLPAWVIVAGILPWAMFNAAFEELVWRGVVWQACEATFGRAAALVLSTLSFGLAHYRGFPFRHARRPPRLGLRFDDGRRSDSSGGTARTVAGARLRGCGHLCDGRDDGRPLTPAAGSAVPPEHVTDFQTR